MGSGREISASLFSPVERLDSQNGAVIDWIHLLRSCIDELCLSSLRVKDSLFFLPLQPLSRNRTFLRSDKSQIIAGAFDLIDSSALTTAGSRVLEGSAENMTGVKCIQTRFRIHHHIQSVHESYSATRKFRNRHISQILVRKYAAPIVIRPDF